MANTIQIKRSAATGTTAPTGLEAGELAWLNNGANGGNGKLFIGSADDTPEMLHIGGLGNGAVSASVVADDIGTGDAAVTLATSAGNITLDAQGNDTDIIFKGTDGGSDTTFLTLDGSAAGAAAFNSTVTATGFVIGSANINEAELETIDGVTAGTVAASKAVVVDSNKDAASFRNVTLTGTLTAADLDISGDVDVDGTLEADAMTLDGTAITTTATLSTGISNNNVPKFTSGVADNDFLRVDGTAIEGRSAAEVLSDIGASAAAGSSSIVTTGALDSGSISSGFGNIDNGSSTFNTGAATVDSLSVSDGNITNVGDIALDSISADGTDINIAVDDNSATALTIKQGSDAYLIVDTANSSESVSIGTGISGTAITLGHGTSEVTVGDNLTVTGNLTVSGTTTTVDSTTVSIADPIFELGASGSDDNLDRGIKMKYNSSGAKVAFMGFDDSTGKFTMIPDATDSSSTFSGTAGTLVMSTFEGNLTGNVTGNINGNLTGTLQTAAQTNVTSLGTLTALQVDNINVNGNTINASSGDLTITAAGGDISFGDDNLDIGGDVDIDGTLEADAMTLDGTAITTTATLSTGISNNNVPKFTSGVADNDFLRVDGTAIEGRSASEVLSDIGGAPAAGDSNIVTTGALNSGSITSGFGSINNGSSAITTTGTITGGALAVDDVSINAKSIVMTGSSSDTVTLTAGTNGTFGITTVDDAAHAADMTITVDGAFIVSGHSGIDIAASGAIDNATIDGGNF